MVNIVLISFKKSTTSENFDKKLYDEKISKIMMFGLIIDLIIRISIRFYTTLSIII